MASINKFGLYSFELVTSQSNTRLPLDGTLTSWQDDVAQRVNEHLILNRAGAIHQDRGTGPRRFVFRCILRGSTASDNYAAIESRLGLEPFGTLIHPRFGTVPYVYMGLKTTEDMDQVISALTAELSLVETGLRDIQATTAGQAARQAAQSSAQVVSLTSSSTTLGPLAAGLDAQVETFLGLVDTAVIVTTSATGQAVSTADVADQYTLAVALAGVQAATSALVAATGADVSLYPLVAAARLSYGQCLQAFAVAGSDLPPIKTYLVAARISLARLCTGLYGGGAQALEDQITRLNRIPNPYAIEAGTPLLIPDQAYVNLDNTPALSSQVVVN